MHQKGTRGLTEEYLGTLHRKLHQRKRDPDLEPEHTHPAGATADATAGATADGAS